MSFLDIINEGIVSLNQIVDVLCYRFNVCLESDIYRSTFGADTVKIDIIHSLDREMIGECTSFLAVKSEQ